MKQHDETPMTFGEFQIDDGLPPLDASEELDWLMSLALDDALDDDEAARFEALLRESPANEARWMAWHAVDEQLQQMPCALPATDFGEKFARRLEIQERQRRLRTGVIFGVAAAAVWASALTGIVMLGALVWSNQGDLMAGMIYNLAYWWAAVGQFGQALLNTLEALWSAPQTRVVLVCYVALALAVLSGWFVFLRRSTRDLSLGEAQLVKA